jgi:hypothetical protein
MRALCAIGGGLLGAGAVWGILALKKRGVFSLGAPVVQGKNAAGVAIRHIRRYAFAASQDKSPVVGLTHASYALMGLDMLEEVAGRDAIRAAGFDPAKVRGFITKLQDAHAERLQGCDPHLQDVLALERGEGAQVPGFVVAGWGPGPTGA